MAGVDQLLKVVEAAAEVVNVVYGVANGAGFFKLFELTDEMTALGSLSGKLVVEQIKDLNEEEANAVVTAYKMKLNLPDKALEGKLEQGVDYLVEGVDIAYGALELVGKGRDLVGKVKSLFSV